jgi:glycyl-tRNA synthetase alpha chain
LAFQDLVLELERFWAAGCVLYQPYDLEAGAGPSIRPLFKGSGTGAVEGSLCSSRGDRPMDGTVKTQQTSALLSVSSRFKTLACRRSGALSGKSSLGWNQFRHHDIRFVQDDGNHPPGAWGLGWEVRLDGMEITVRTFGSGRNQPGSRDDRDHLRLEGIAMYLQGWTMCPTFAGIRNIVSCDPP